MGGGQAHAVRKAFFADDRQRDALAAVDKVDLIAGLCGIAGHPCAEAFILGQTDDFTHCVALGLTLVQKLLVALGIGLDILFVTAGQFVKTGFLVIKKLFRSHFSSPLRKMVYKASVSRQSAERSPLFSKI